MLTVLTLACLAWAAPEMIPEEDVDLIGRTAPEIEGQRQDGSHFSLRDHRGEVVVLSFWASWCGPCRQELPALSKLKEQRSDLSVFAVNVDRDQKDAQRFLKQVKFDLPIVWDNQAMALGGYNVMSMPTMFLIDGQGTVKWTKVGYSQQKGLTELEAALGRL